MKFRIKCEPGHRYTLPMARPGSDTLPDVALRQRQMLAGLSVQERADLMASLCDAVTEAAIAGIQLEHPDATESKIRSELLRRRYGEEYVASLPAGWR